MTIWKMQGNFMCQGRTKRTNSVVMQTQSDGQMQKPEVTQCNWFGRCKFGSSGVELRVMLDQPRCRQHSRTRTNQQSTVADDIVWILYRYRDQFQYMSSDRSGTMAGYRRAPAGSKIEALFPKFLRTPRDFSKALVQILLLTFENTQKLCYIFSQDFLN